MPVRLTTDDLELSPIQEGDLERVLEIRLANRDRLARTEGSGGEVGTYDLARLERDVTIALADPARHLLVARERATGDIVAYVDALAEHPDDGHPWLGAVEVGTPWQGQGYGRQCAEAVAGWASTGLDAAALRAAADDDDATATGFLEHLGFVPVDRRRRVAPHGEADVTVFEERRHR